jgi:hemoglobin-like flavoprotein
MTPEQLDLITQTLPDIQAHAEGFSAEFYERCFILFPESRELVSGDLGRALIDEFLRLASSVNDLDAFVARAHELGVMHRGWGASREHYDTIEEALSCALEATLGERYDEPTAHAWHRLYRLMAETMLEGSAGVAFVAPRRS